MKLSVLVPCYNEEKTIQIIIDRILEQKYSNKEIIIIDDFSNDNTTDILKNIKNEKIKVIFNNKNYGKGFCLQKGIDASDGEIIIIQDADLEYDPNDYHKMINPIIEGHADVVFGSRFLGSQEHRVLYFWHRVGNSILTIISNIFSNLNLTDMECGLKAFKSNIIKKIELKENRFGFEPEITMKVAKLNLRIYEVGIRYFGRTYAEGKKINWKDGVSAIRCIVKYFFAN
jgi:glycosyltransferase involved in cell wall biosynthesis